MSNIAAFSGSMANDKNSSALSTMAESLPSSLTIETLYVDPRQIMFRLIYVGVLASSLHYL